MNSKTQILDRDRIKELYWNKKYNVKEIAKKLGVSFWTVYNSMNQYKIVRRDRSEANFVVNRYKPQFMPKDNLTFKEEYLRIAGIMLYWAEGTLRGGIVDFANSNPEMIRIFLRFLREICGVKEERLRIYLYAYSYQDIKAIKRYWHRVTEIPISQFTKPYVRKDNPNLSRRKLPYGLVHVRYNDKRLLELIKNWRNEYIKNWAGAGVVNRSRL